MYEEYSQEVQNKIKELGLYGKTPRQIIRETVMSCERMKINENDFETKKALGTIQEYLLKYLQEMER